MEPSSVVIIVSRVFSRRKRFRAFSQPASVPRKRPFPDSFRVLPRPSVYLLWRQNLFPHWCLCEKTCFHTGGDSRQLRKEYQRQRNFTEQDVTPWSKGVHPSKSIKLNAAIFSQKEKNLYYNLRSRSKNQSTPKSKVDACVECDFPFDESKISPELRRGPVTKERTSSELLEPSHKNSVGFNKTNL